MEPMFGGFKEELMFDPSTSIIEEEEEEEKKKREELTPGGSMTGDSTPIGNYSNSFIPPFGYGHMVSTFPFSNTTEHTLLYDTNTTSTCERIKRKSIEPSSTSFREDFDNRLSFGIAQQHKKARFRSKIEYNTFNDDIGGISAPGSSHIFTTHGFGKINEEEEEEEEEEEIPSEQITLLIKTLTGRLIDVIVNPIETINNVKQVIEEKQGIPKRQQRLIFRGKHCADDRTIGEYGIEDHSVLHLILAL